MLELALGVITAMGGFVDIGELVFAASAGAHFSYGLVWAVLVGSIGIYIFNELAGRVAAVAHEPVFAYVRRKLGEGWGRVSFAGSLMVNIITCAAEVGGIALILQLLTGFPYPLLVIIGGIFIAAALKFLPFKAIENLFGILGVLLVAFTVAFWKLHPDWSALAHGLYPNLSSLGSANDFALYAYFAVGLISSTMMPYETHFYSSGAIEQKWTPKDIGQNRISILLGYFLGAALTISVIGIAAEVLQPRGIIPELVGTTALTALVPFSHAGLLVGLLGMLFVVGGAAVETCLGTAYIIAQFLGWKWGVEEQRKAGGAPLFTKTWMIVLALVTVVMATGINPIQVVEYAVVFGIVALPLTYLPILLIANDKSVMREYRIGPVMRTLGWLYLVLVTIVALAAIPLMIITQLGQS
jgi:manganese transport protein